MDTLNSVVDKINARLEKSPLFYLCNDPERALGLEGLINNYHIAYIDKSQYTNYFQDHSLKYFCLENFRADGIYRSSGKLIKAPEFLEYFDHNSQAENFFQTFKISPRFEFGARKLGATVLNTQSDLNRLFEDKISQYKEISELTIHLPKTVITELGKAEYLLLEKSLGPKFVIQFDRGHTGSGTVFIDAKEDFEKLKSAFPMRHVRISELAEGRPYTLNACVGEKSTFMGGLSAQITGVIGLTPQKGGTVGNDWSYRSDLVKGNQTIVNDVNLIGEKMRSKGYRGLFGVDFIVKPDGEHVIIEINARQPASIPMYTKMQILSDQIPLSAIHLMEFLGIKYEISATEYNMINLEPQNCSQIFIRPELDMKISQELPMGVYSLKGDSVEDTKEKVIFIDDERDKSISMIKKSYSIDHLDQGGFLLLTQSQGRLIKANSELARMQIKQSALDESGYLKPWISEILIAVKEYQI